MGKHQKAAVDDTAAAPEHASVDPSVDKIRDILFGGHMRDYEQRFEQLESVIAEHTQRLAEDTQRRVSKLEQFVRTELDKLGETVSRERKDRMQERDASNEHLKELKGDIAKWLAELEEKTAGEARAIRTSVHEQGEELGQLLGQTREHIETSLKREARQLQEHKVSREDLAALLSEVALRLNREFELPEK